MEEYVEAPKRISKDDRIVQIFSDERYNFYLLMRSGRVFKKRARGQSGAYDRWQEVDVLSEVRDDLFPDETNNHVED